AVVFAAEPEHVIRLPVAVNVAGGQAGGERQGVQLSRGIAQRLRGQVETELTVSADGDAFAGFAERKRGYVGVHLLLGTHHTLELPDVALIPAALEIGQLTADEAVKAVVYGLGIA